MDSIEFIFFWIVIIPLIEFRCIVRIKEEIHMETRIVEVEEFNVKGYGLRGPLSEIPG